MVSIKNLAILATGVSAAVLPRQAPVVLTDLYTLNADVNTLTEDVSQGALNSFNIAGDIIQLERDLNVAINDADASPAITGTDATEVATFLQNTGSPDILAAVNALEEQKSAFFAALLQPTVEIDLKNLKRLASEYFPALSSAVPSESSVITPIGQEVVASLARAQADFAV